ncbi:hypothetical protein PV10_04143 [Exophiala mesophila]|uniref:Mid2 domain-containing protein n=1 Tax=Exophiala mesophila TaxID=212818 RepID=A0A0D1ZGB5_EXOME|nr:uncharacterized protein PV10_04143 [Exophiala mesophila]KIV92879.1 hypothetical protein PV10_04143 [Exophiala mesophila]
MDFHRLWKRQSEAATNTTTLTELSIVSVSTSSPTSIDASAADSAFPSSDPVSPTSLGAVATGDVVSSFQQSDATATSISSARGNGDLSQSTIVLVTESAIIESNPTNGVETTKYVVYTTTIVSEPSTTQAAVGIPAGGRDLSRNTGAIIGIAAGIAICLALLLMGLAIFILRWRRKRAVREYATPYPPNPTSGTSVTASVEGGMVEPIEKYGRERLEMSGNSEIRVELPEKSAHQRSVFELDAGVDSIRTPVSGLSGMNSARPMGSGSTVWSWQAGQTEKATYIRNVGGSKDSERSDSTPSVADSEERPVSPTNMLSSRTNRPPTLQPGS